MGIVYTVQFLKGEDLRDAVEGELAILPAALMPGESIRFETEQISQAIARDVSTVSTVLGKYPAPMPKTEAVALLRAALNTCERQESKNVKAEHAINRLVRYLS